jgi:hypothetical protein
LGAGKNRKGGVIMGQGEEVRGVAKGGVGTLPCEGDGEEAEEVETLARRENRHGDDGLEAARARDDASGERRDVRRVRENEIELVRAQGGFRTDQEGMKESRI